MRKLRRHGRVDREASNLTRRNATQHIVEPIDIHRFRKRVAHHLAHQWMIGNFNVADHRLRTRRRMRKHARQQIVRARALNLRSHTLALLHSQQLQRPARSPPPAIFEERRWDGRLLQQLARRLLREELKHVRKREAVLFRERDIDAVIRSRRLELEVEAATEALAQCEPPRLVQPTTERRMQDELLPTTLIEESLRNNR